MNIAVNKNKVCIDKIVRTFAWDISTYIDFSDYIIILLMSDNVPDDNVIAINGDGTTRWIISDIIKLPYPEAYISLKKYSMNSIAVVSYNGLMSIINVEKMEVVSKQITK